MQFKKNKIAQKAVRMLTRFPKYAQNDNIFMNNRILKLSGIPNFGMRKFIYRDLKKTMFIV